jgi:hypothetical protein
MAMIQIQQSYSVYGNEAREPMFINTMNVEYLKKEYFGDYGISFDERGYLAITRDEFKRLKPLFEKAMVEDEKPTAIAVFNRETPEWSYVHIVHQAKAEETLKRLQDGDGQSACIVGLVDERKYLPPDETQLEIAELERKLAEVEHQNTELRRAIQHLSVPSGKARVKALNAFVDRLIAETDRA